MTATPAGVLEYLRTVDVEYKDNRCLSERGHRALVWLLYYGENVFSQVSRTWRGVSFRQADAVCRLVVKSTRAGVREVAYVTGRTPTDCVLIFCRMWHQDRVEWVPDKYR